MHLKKSNSFNTFFIIFSIKFDRFPFSIGASLENLNVTYIKYLKLLYDK